MAPLFLRIQHVSARNLTLFHELENLSKLGQANDLEGSLDLPSSKEFNGLCRVFAVSNVGTADLDHSNDRTENWRLQVSTGRQTDADNSAAWANVLSSLLEWPLVDGEKNDGVGAETVLSGGLHVLDDVLALGEIDECVRPELLAHLLLLLSGIDGNGSETHGLCVLLSERTETSSSSDDGYSLAWAGTGLLETLVHGDTGTENWGDLVEWDFFGDSGNVCGLGDTVLLEGSVNCVTRDKSLSAERFVRLLTEITLQAAAIEPLYTSMITDLYVLDQ